MGSEAEGRGIILSSIDILSSVSRSVQYARNKVGNESTTVSVMGEVENGVRNVTTLDGMFQSYYFQSHDITSIFSSSVTSALRLDQKKKRKPDWTVTGPSVIGPCTRMTHCFRVVDLQVSIFIFPSQLNKSKPSRRDCSVFSFICFKLFLFLYHSWTKQNWGSSWASKFGQTILKMLWNKFWQLSTNLNLWYICKTEPQIPVDMLQLM